MARLLSARSLPPVERPHLGRAQGRPAANGLNHMGILCRPARRRRCSRQRIALTMAVIEAASAEPAPLPSLRTFLALALGSAGVVYGDIGTSPLYAFKESIAHLRRAGG